MLARNARGTRPRGDCSCMAVLARDKRPIKTWVNLKKADVRTAVPHASMHGKISDRKYAYRDDPTLPGNGEPIAAFQAARTDAVCLFYTPLLAARQNLGSGNIVVSTPAESQASSAAMRKDDKGISVPTGD